jgi:RNA polymerase sigma-70 factor (ECF subfamily)
LHNVLRQDHRDFTGYCEDFVQEALIIILKRLPDFQGLSRFTTWAHKITVRVALAELRRARWKDTSLEDDETVASPPDPALESVEDHMMLTWVKKIMEEELTPLQRTALTALAVQGMSSDAVVVKLDTTRGALYKLVHDARLKLRQRLMLEGLMVDPSEQKPPQERKNLFVASREVEHG